MLNLINHEWDIAKIYLHSKDPYQKYEDVGTKHFNDSKAFIEYSNNMVDIYKNIEDK